MHNTAIYPPFGSYMTGKTQTLTWNSVKNVLSGITFIGTQPCGIITQTFKDNQHEKHNKIHLKIIENHFLLYVSVNIKIYGMLLVSFQRLTKFPGAKTVLRDISRVVIFQDKENVLK